MGDAIIKNMSKFMLTPKNMVNFTRYKFKREEKIEINKTKVVRYNKNFFVPGHKDKLFWIFYILQNGFENYELIGNNIFQVEKEEKLNLISVFNAKLKLLKEVYKFKRLDVCESELLNEEKISLKTFHALCVIYNFNVLFIKERTYCKLSIFGDEEEIDNYFIIHQIGDDYVYEFKPRIEILNSYLENKFEISNYEKPIKSIGSYKLSDLKDMAGLMKFNTPVMNLKKQELYDKICEYLNLN